MIEFIKGIVVINDENFTKDQTGSVVISKITNNDQRVFFGAPNTDLVKNVFKIKEDFKVRLEREIKNKEGFI